MVSGCSLQCTVLMTAAFIFVGGILVVRCQSIGNEYPESMDNDHTEDPYTEKGPFGEDGDSPNLFIGIKDSLLPESLKDIVLGLVGGKGQTADWGLRLEMEALRMDIGAFREQLAQFGPCSSDPDTESVNTVDTVDGPHSGQGNRPSGASVYVRWGNGNCSGNAQLVYSGLIGGSHYRKSGGAANHLCLPLDPEFTSDLPTPVYGKAPVYGVEYETRPHPSHDKDALCSVCRVPRATTLTIPARLQCPDSWTLEYSGYLMAGKPDNGRPSTEYLCVDSQLQGRKQSTVKDENEGVLYPAQTHCGSLPCPPFREGSNLPCVVCSL